MNTPTARHAALYARISTAGQDLQRQLVELRAYAQRAGLHVVGEFAERDLCTTERKCLLDVLALRLQLDRAVASLVVF